MELFEIKELREKLGVNLEKLYLHLEIENKLVRLKELNKEFEDGSIWNFPEKSSPVYSSPTSLCFPFVIR